MVEAKPPEVEVCALSLRTRCGSVRATWENGALVTSIHGRSGDTEKAATPVAIKDQGSQGSALKYW